MCKPTEPQISVTDTADIKVLSVAAPSWSVQKHDPTQMFPHPDVTAHLPHADKTVHRFLFVVFSLHHHTSRSKCSPRTFVIRWQICYDKGVKSEGVSRSLSPLSQTPSGNVTRLSASNTHQCTGNIEGSQCLTDAMSVPFTSHRW